jgi:single-strand DNA-binding protein
MSPSRRAAAVVEAGEPSYLNTVQLRGRWTGAEERQLPSGDLLVTARLVVPRATGGVDTLDCAVWTAGLRKRVLAWPDDCQAEVTGSLRRRFWRTAGGPASRYEVEVQSARRVRPAAAASEVGGAPVAS